MKKLAILLLAVVMTACAAPAAPTQEAVAPTVVEPTATPIVVVQTVVVEATQAPTDVPPPTTVPPTEVPPTAAPVVVTVVVQATDAPAVAANPTSDGSVAIDAAFGKGVFTNMTMSSANLTLRCAPRDVTFNVTTPNVDIVDVQFYYRVVDLKRLYPSEWKAVGKFANNGNGNFTFVFKGEDVSSDLRIDGSYIDFQFVGLAKSGNVVDRSDKIESLLKYTFDCP